MDNTLEMDQTILKKNLEITKLTQQIDTMISSNIDNRITSDMQDTLDITYSLMLTYCPKGDKYTSLIDSLDKVIKHIKSTN